MSTNDRGPIVARIGLLGVRSAACVTLCVLGACAQIAGIDSPTQRDDTNNTGASGGSGGGEGGAGGIGGNAGAGGTAGSSSSSSSTGGGAGGGNCMPTEMACDGKDDDCNGQIDDLPLLPCGMGVCQVTVPACVNGMPSQCIPNNPTAEVCNGLDDDCNGSTDENNPEGGVDCTTGIPGPCSAGKTECISGMIGCTPNVMPIAEVCNNVDDDCDGMVDDGNPGGGNICPTDQLGECANGTSSCLSGSLICMAPMPMEDVCDGLDNDCDGEPDNHGVGNGIPCMTGIPGECSTGFTNCENAVLVCNQSKLSVPEICDNLDNDCDGMVDDGNPDGGATCTVAGQKGACAVGAMACQGGIVTCTQTVQTTTEVCDGVDNDCDGDVDEGPDIGCGTCQSSILPSIGGGSCTTMSLPGTVTLTEMCKQVFPAPANTSIPVTIGNPGTQYYVSPVGNDSNDGTTPAKAWATLCQAVAMVRPGNTIQVAQGVYLSTQVVLGKGVTIKGGYNTNFTLWNPEAYPAIFYGRLTLDHASAVWGGFRMIGNTINAAQSQHMLKAGSFVRNYVEAVFASSVMTQSSAIDATACAGATLTFTGNDVYAGAENATPVGAVGFAYQKGAMIFDSNRMCAQGKSNGLAYAISGFGPNTSDPASLLLRNNVLETANSGGYVIFLAGQDGGVDFTTTMTNNTLLGSESGAGGTAASNNGKMRWRLTNNILFNLSGTGTGVSFGAGSGVSFDTAENNLVFGFMNNALAQPVPVVSINNDTSNSATGTSVFLNAPMGDLRIDVGGQADETGRNVYNLGSYGFVTTDITQSPRPAAGSWDRGAFKN